MRSHYYRLGNNVRLWYSVGLSYGLVYTWRIHALIVVSNPVKCDSRPEHSRQYEYLSRPRIPDLRNWSKAIGILLNENCNLLHTSDKGIGLVCQGNTISLGQSIVRVPQKARINADNVEADPHFGTIIGPLRSAGLDDRGVISLWILLQSQNIVHPWGPYIACLPSKSELSRSHPLLINESVTGSPIASSCSKMTTNLQRQIRSIARAVTKLGHGYVFGDDPASDWIWAHVLVLTRSGLLRDQNPQDDWSRMPVCILPMIDFCNHSDSPNAAIRIDKGGVVELVALRDIKPGEEITISYWPEDRGLNSEQCLFSFGFLSGLNTFIVPGVDFHGADQFPKKAMQRLVFIDSRSHEGEEIFMDEMNLAVDYFAIECMSESTIRELKQAYISEGGIGERSRAILTASAAAGSSHCRDS